MMELNVVKDLMKVSVIGITAISIMVIFESCKKEPILVPSLSTFQVTEIKQSSAKSGGRLFNDGNAQVTALGICWSTHLNPTVADLFTTENIERKEFKSTMTGLTGGTVYHVRAYATNSLGTGYGERVSFTTSPAAPSIVFNPNLNYGSVSDNDGNTYKIIQIGTQTWMAENLKTTKYNDGSLIPNATTWSAWENSTAGAYCWYENGPSYKDVYGALYSGRTVLSGKLCPAGWHIPEMSEFNTLVDYLGGKTIAAGKLKETGTTHWEFPNVGATNESGFTAIPGGYNVSINVHFYDLGTFNFLWTTTSEGVNRLGTVQIHHTEYISIEKSIDSGTINDGYSVRCIKD